MIKQPLKYFPLISASYLFLVLLVLTGFLIINSTDYVEVSGTISPLEFQVIAPLYNGILKQKFRQDGDIVHAGDPLIQIDPSELLQNKQIREMEMMNLKNMDQLQVRKKSILDQDYDFFNKKITQDRFSLNQKLKNNVISRFDYNSQLYSIEKDILNRQLEIENLTYEINQNRNVIQMKEVDLQELNKKIDRSTIYSLMDGIVVENDDTIKEGRFYTTADTIMTVYSAKEIYAKVEIPENSISKIETGQKVTILVNAIPYTRFKTFRGSIREFNKVTKNSRPVYVGLITIDDPYFEIKNNEELKKRKLVFGMSMKARINTGKIKLFNKMMGVDY
jgi:multidrug resistance efflux pump